MAAPETIVELNREQFLAALHRSGVLTDRQFDKAVGALTASQQTGREVADLFVKNEWLTQFQIGRLLFGKADGFLLGPYVVQDYLAKTASGRVYKAIHRTMNRPVAVLVLALKSAANETVRESIREQARTAARLAHPNLITLLDVNNAGERMYLVQEYIDGGDLRSLVRKLGPLSVPKACEFMRQASLGLQHAHEKGMVHGRLSPTTLLVGRPGGYGPEDKPVVKVSGLGLGNLASTEQPAEYTAPELSGNPSPTAAADLFALGGVLHFLLTGHPPHPATPLRTLRYDLPAPLLAMVDGLLAADPSLRLSSAADVVSVLTAFAADDSTFIDFTLSTTGSSCTSSFSGQHSLLPVGIPLIIPEALNPPIEQLPVADLDEPDSSTESTVNGLAVYTPLHTVQRKQGANRRGSRPRKRNRNLSQWLGLAGAVVVLVLAGAALAVLVKVVKG